MTEREILIANNRDQSKYRVITGAETLGQLQQDIARNENVYKMVGQTWLKNTTPINISGLTFTEGITKTQLLSPETQLPTNVQFKGQTTNNLVMLLTNTTKQIRSGAGDRKEVYRLVKELGLAEAIQDGEKQNYTRCKTEVLWSYIDIARNGAEKADDKVLAETRKELENIGAEKAPEKKLPDVKDTPHAATVEWFYDGIKKMAADNLFYAEDVVVLAELTSELAARLVESKPKITTSDMDDMMKNISR